MHRGVKRAQGCALMIPGVHQGTSGALATEVVDVFSDVVNVVLNVVLNVVFWD